MMRQFYHYLMNGFEQSGYGAFEYQDRIFMAKQQQEGKILLLRILTEPLPGQNPVDLQKEHSVMETVARNLMINHRSLVESLMVYLVSGRPETELISQMKDYEDFWFLDIQNGRLFIYEEQKSHFYNLEKELEEKALSWIAYKKEEKKQNIKYNLTPMNTLMILLNVLVFVILSVLGDTENAQFIAEHGGMVYNLVVAEKQFYLLFTSMFVHFGGIHLIENMLTLFLLGQILERNVGKIAYLTIYLGAGLISSLTSLFLSLRYEPFVVSGGASGAVSGVLGGIFFLILYNIFVQRKNNLEGISLRGVLFIILISIGYGFTVSGVDNYAHIGGLIGGFVLTGIIRVLIGEKTKI